MEEKAIRFDKYGPPSVLSLVDIERPALRSGEVLVEIKASAINPSDVGNVAAVRDESLSRLLVDEEESLNRLHNIVSQVGLRILFFDEKERLAGRYGSATKGDHQAACAERTDNRVSAEKELPGGADF
jgi:hypothetical protein